MEIQASRKPRGTAIEVTVKGVVYESISQAWRSRVIPSFSKLRDYVVLKKDLNVLEQDNRAKSVTLNGVLYSSVIKAFEDTGITPNRIHYAIRKYKTRIIKINVLQSKKGRENTPLTLNDIVYESVAQASKRTGISICTINKKLMNNTARIVTYIDKENCLPITVNGILYPSISEASISTGICMTTLITLRKVHHNDITTHLTKR